MKTSSIVSAALAPAAASAQWYNGAPSCAQSCLSSAYSSVASTASGAYWPAQDNFCSASVGNAVSTCLNSACSATPTAWTSYSSLSSSLCSQWSSCSSGGSTGVQTITFPAGSVTWGAPGGWPTGVSGGAGGFPGGGNWGPGGSGGGDWGNWGGASNSQLWSEWQSAYSGGSTWSGGVLTVTGCLANGSPWYVGPGGGWNNQGGFNGWVGWGAGWSQGPTSTATVTYTTTYSGGSVSTYTGLATVAAAVSGDITATQTFSSPGATSTSGSGSNNGPTGAAARLGGSDSSVTTMMVLALAGVVAVAGML